MPIRINLLNEALAEVELRRRDPVKRSIYVGAFLVVLSLVWFSTTWLDGKVIQQKKNQVEIEMDTHTNEFSRIQSNLKQLSDTQQRLNALLQLNTNRFLQGTFLNALQQIYVPNIQLLRLKLDQSYSHTPGVATTTNTYGTLVPGHPATATEQISLTLDAKDSSPNPGDQVNLYKDALGKHAYFKSHLNVTNGVKLSNITTTPQIGLNGKPYVLFTVEYHFQNITR